MENQDSKINNKKDFDDNYELESYHGDYYEINEQTKEKLLKKGSKATCKIIL